MEDYDARSEQMGQAFASLEVATDEFRNATNGMQGLINGNTYKKMDKMLGEIQKLEYDIKEWMIRNGLS